jgi:DNA-binding PadR family transcriptional regulator
VTSEWRDQAGERARRYYFITGEGREQLKAFRADWADFANIVESVLFPSPAQAPLTGENRADNSKKSGDSGPSARDDLGEGARR